jgi:signal transduction histidine kinase
LKAEVVIDVHGDVAPIRVVPTDIEQVLLNLANNAIDSMEKSSGERTLRFEARQRPTPQAGQRTELQIIVRDTGEGMSPEILKNVRKPFFTTKAPGQGTGLGLTISQRLIKKYGGKLELESQLGRGTAVTISIPYDAA